MGFLSKVGAGLSKVGLNPVDLIKSGGPAGLLGKYQSDLDQQMAYEMADKNFDLSRQGFDLQKQENLASFERNKALAYEMFDKEKQYNLDLWKMQNEYNTPKAQMARLEEAGLSKASMYGQGNVGNATVIHSAEMSKPSYESAKYDVPKISTPQGGYFLKGLMDYVGIRNAEIQRENMEAQNSLIKANTRIANEQARLTSENADSVARENELLRRAGGSKYDWAPVRYVYRSIDAGKRFGKAVAEKLDLKKRLYGPSRSVRNELSEYSGYRDKNGVWRPFILRPNTVEGLGR